MNKKICLVLILAALIIAGCSNDVPKTLAKQTYDLGIEAMSSLLDPVKYADIEKKITDIEKKVEKLSITQKLAYEAELRKLVTSGIGSLFNSAASGLLDTASKAVENVSAQDVQNLLNNTSDIIDSASKKIDEISTQDLEKALNEAASALKSLGF